MQILTRIQPIFRMRVDFPYCSGTAPLSRSRASTSTHLRRSQNPLSIFKWKTQHYDHSMQATYLAHYLPASGSPKACSNVILIFDIQMQSISPLYVSPLRSPLPSSNPLSIRPFTTSSPYLPSIRSYTSKSSSCVT